MRMILKEFLMIKIEMEVLKNMENNIVQNLGINLYLVLQKGETVVLTKEIKKSFKYKIESGGST